MCAQDVRAIRRTRIRRRGREKLGALLAVTSKERRHVDEEAFLLRKREKVIARTCRHTGTRGNGLVLVLHAKQT